MYIFIYMHVFVRKYMYIHVFVYVCLCVHTCVRVCVCGTLLGQKSYIKTNILLQHLLLILTYKIK